MIKIEKAVLPSSEHWEFAIKGMRNPLNSWKMSDSEYVKVGLNERDYIVGDKDEELAMRLSRAGSEHRKYLRQLPVCLQITAPFYWWKEFETYKVGTVSNSCSTMHTIAKRPFVMGDFSTEHLITTDYIFSMFDVEEDKDIYDDLLVDASSLDNRSEEYSPYGMLKLTIKTLNMYRELYVKALDRPDDFAERYKMTPKDVWWQLIQLLPSSYNQTRSVTLNYEVIANIYGQRRNHKLDEWNELCGWFEQHVPYFETMIAPIFR